MKRRRTRRSFLSSNFGKLHALNPELADFLSNLSSGGADAVLTNDFTVTEAVGGVEVDTQYAAGTPLEQIIIEMLTGVTSGSIQAFFVNDQNTDTIATGVPYMAGDEPIEIASVSYIINDPSLQFVADSGIATIQTNATNTTVTPIGTGLGVDNGQIYSNIAFDNSTTYTVGTNTGGYEDFPWATNHFLNTTLKISANKNIDGTESTYETGNKTIQHVLPCFLLPVHLILDADTLTDVTLLGTQHLEDALSQGLEYLVANLTEAGTSITGYDAFHTATAGSNLIIKKFLHGNDNADVWNNEEWFMPVVAPPTYGEDLGPQIGATLYDMWKFLLFVPRTRWEVQNNIPIVAYQNGADSTADLWANSNNTGSPVDVNLNNLGIITNAPDQWTAPYQMYEIAEPNGLDGATTIFKFEA